MDHTFPCNSDGPSKNVQLWKKEHLGLELCESTKSWETEPAIMIIIIIIQHYVQWPRPPWILQTYSYQQASMKILNSPLEMLNSVVILNTFFLWLLTILILKKLFSAFCFEGSYAFSIHTWWKHFPPSRCQPELLWQTLFIGEWEPTSTRIYQCTVLSHLLFHCLFVTTNYY